MINVIIQRGKNCLSWDWYNWIFDDPIYNILQDDNWVIKKDNSIVVYSTQNKNPDKIVLDYFKAISDKKYALYHLGEESPGHDLNHYKNAKLVLRYCWWPELKSYNNVIPFPMGYWSGFQNLDGKIKKASERKYNWIFTGQLKNDRSNMVETLKKIEPYSLHLTRGFNSSNYFPPNRMKELYQDTVFVPCPKGNIHVECYRTYDALEHGCIPIVKKYDGSDYYQHVLGNHPFIVVNDWNEFNPSNIDIDKKQEEVFSWYGNYKDNLKRTIKEELIKVIG